MTYETISLRPQKTFSKTGVHSTFTIGSSTYTNGQTGSYSGTVSNVYVNVPANYQMIWVYGNKNPPTSEPTGVYVPNISANPATMEIDGNGWIKAEYSAKVTFYTSPSDKGSISWGSCLNTGRTNGQYVYDSIPSGGTTTACANIPTDYTLTGWSCTGGLSCSGSNPTTTVGFTGPGSITASFSGPPTTRQWTYMVYTAYDNDLGRDTKGLASSLLNRLQSVGSTSQVDVVVLVDEYGHNTHYYHIESGGHTERTDYPGYGTNVDTTNYASLKQFIT